MTQPQAKAHRPILLLKWNDCSFQMLQAFPGTPETARICVYCPDLSCYVCVISSFFFLSLFSNSLASLGCLKCSGFCHLPTAGLILEAGVEGQVVPGPLLPPELLLSTLGRPALAWPEDWSGSLRKVAALSGYRLEFTWNQSSPWKSLGSCHTDTNN